MNQSPALNRARGNRTARLVPGLCAVAAFLAVAAALPVPPTSAAAPSAGATLSWGVNGSGRLGDGSTDTRSIPVPAKALADRDVTAVAAGFDFSLALRSDGSVLAWGDNKVGQLGDGSFTPRGVPKVVPNLNSVVQLAVGADGQFALARTSSGLIFAWGDNSYGQLGQDPATTPKSPIPMGVTGVGTASWVAAGGRHSLAVKSDGTVMAWGDNSAGQLGDGTATTRRSTPTPVSGLDAAPRVTAVSAGDDFSLALRGGGVMAWGSNTDGRLGDGTHAQRLTPVAVTNPGQSGALTDVKAIAAGSDHSLALLVDTTLVAWGNNVAGQLGRGRDGGSAAVPKAVMGLAGQPAGASLTGVTAVAGGDGFSVAVAGGTVIAWGLNQDGELGDGMPVNPAGGQSCFCRPALMAVNGVAGGDLKDAISVAAGAFHALAVTSSSSPSTTTTTLRGSTTSTTISHGSTTTTTAPSSTTSTTTGGTTTTVAGAADGNSPGGDGGLTDPSDGDLTSDGLGGLRGQGSGALAFTGGDIAPWGHVAELVMLVGLGLLRLGRRRRPSG
ncbi:MAG: cell wall anchor protein [Actinobacteria bacterium]|nr:cell wall anchor protein [Actinomycetota bacterium]